MVAVSTSFAQTDFLAVMAAIGLAEAAVTAL
jgi:hypothetical protein